MKNYFLIPLFVALLILASCAQIVAPSGGPKDEKPPEIIDIAPANKSVNFKSEGQAIRIRFDEFIQLRDANNQILISPPLNRNPEYIVAGKSLIVQFNETLEKKTTYTINFGSAITDNHEGKALENFTYTFSTGAHLDSNFIAGTIRNAFTNEPSPGVTVALWPWLNFQDSMISKQNPVYYSKSKSDGTYRIENIPADSFFIIAYKKEGTSVKYQKNDSVAIFSNPVHSTINAEHVAFIFKPDLYRTGQVLDTFNKYANVFSFVVYRPEMVVIKPDIKTSFYMQKKTGPNLIDTLTYYFSGDPLSEVTFNYLSPDTTYIIRLHQNRKAKAQPFLLTTAPALMLNDTVKVNLSNPFISINSNYISLSEDTTFISPRYFSFDSSNHFFARIYHPWKESTRYSLAVKDSAFKDIYGTYNSSLAQNYTTGTINDYGTLLLGISYKNYKGNLILQLTGKSNEIVKEFNCYRDTSIRIDYLQPNQLKLKVILDTNKSGRWDNGNLETKSFPERTYWHQQLFNIRAFWDLEQNVDLDEILSE